MITKCKRLKNVGKFSGFSTQANALDWHKNTFVFAPNAYASGTRRDSGMDTTVLERKIDRLVYDPIICPPEEIKIMEDGT